MLDAVIFYFGYASYANCNKAEASNFVLVHSFCIIYTCFSSCLLEWCSKWQCC